MKKENLMDGLGGIDHDLIEEAERYPKRKRINLWTKVGALAASVAVIVSLGLLLPRWRDNQTAITDAHKLTGVQELILGEDTVFSDKALIMGPHFALKTVIEARVIEVLPDTYRLCVGRESHVVKLEVLDEICGVGLPEEIYLSYPYYDTRIFDGYDRFILSVAQVGVENYMLQNVTEKQVQYFPHMFQADSCNDLGYGSVIAFMDGQVDESFWEKANYLISRVPDGENHFQMMLEDTDELRYPAAYGDTLEDVKVKIRSMADLAKTEENGAPRDYWTEEDFFTSAESRALQDYLSPDSANVFQQSVRLAVGDTWDLAWALEYTRVVNGFLTDEVITVNLDGGKVEYSGKKYSAEDLSKLPNLGTELANMDLSALSPPHIDPEEEVRLVYAQANGFYRKVGDEVYGIIRVKWRYRPNSGGNRLLEDDYYCIYDAYGNSQVLERDALKAIIGDDPLIERFGYKWQLYK